MTTEDTVQRQTYSVEEAAQILGIGRASAYQAVHAGEIPSIQIGSRLVVPKTALDNMIAGAGREQSPQPEDTLC